MTTDYSAPGTTRYYCPLACGWFHDVPPPSLEDAVGIVSDPSARDLSEAISSIASKAVQRRADQTEQALRGHLDTHTSEEDRATLQRFFVAAGVQPPAD